VPHPTIHLSLLDGVVICAFIAIIMALGFSTKLRDNSVLQYLAAGRSLSMPAFVATLVSTWYGGVLAVGDSVKSYGIGGIYCLASHTICSRLFTPFFMPEEFGQPTKLASPSALQAVLENQQD